MLHGLNTTKSEFVDYFARHFDEIAEVCRMSPERKKQYIDEEYESYIAHYRKVDKAIARAADYAERHGTYIDETIFESFFEEVK